MMRFALVFDGHCAGFVLARRHQFEALGADETSLGLFETENDAVIAITQKLSVTKST
jgi:hypothetical protein